MSEWFAIVDCARDARLHALVERSEKRTCLYSGDYDDDTRKALPYLVQLDRAEPLAETWRQHESGRFWGMLCDSDCSLAELRRHFRKFTTARLPDGEIVLFRFWDPRVFEPFALAGTAEEVAPIFSAVASFVADPGGGRRRYEWNGRLLINGQPVSAAA